MPRGKTKGKGHGKPGGLAEMRMEQPEKRDPDMEMVLKWKAEGNACFAKKDFKMASNLYMNAYGYLDEAKIKESIAKHKPPPEKPNIWPGPNDLIDLPKKEINYTPTSCEWAIQCSILDSNACECYLQLANCGGSGVEDEKLYDWALMFAQKSLQTNKHNFKAWKRLTKCNVAKDLLQPALYAAEQSVRVATMIKASKDEIAACEKLAQEVRQKLVDLHSKKPTFVDPAAAKTYVKPEHRESRITYFGCPNSCDKTGAYDGMMYTSCMQDYDQMLMMESAHKDCPRWDGRMPFKGSRPDGYGVPKV